MRIELGAQHVLFIHLTLVPYIATSGETKTKPTQHSVKELRSIGIQPDVLICRSEKPLSLSDRLKIALFTNVEKEGVISLQDAKSIYQIPMILHEQNLDELVIKKLGLHVKPADLSEWQQVVDAQAIKTMTVVVGIVGKYTELSDAYKSINEALLHAGIHTQTAVKIKYIDADLIEKQGNKSLSDVDAILIPGGFGERGVKGKIDAIRYARERKIPFLGICLGLQTAVIEFAQNVAQLAGANSTEFDKNTPYPVIALINEDEDLGGTMRLGAQICALQPGSLAYKVYGKPEIEERHRHRYEVNQRFIDQLTQQGLIISGRSLEGNLVEMVELADHPWFLACQFHPEFTSTPRDSHPLFQAFVEAARAYHQAKKKG